MSDAALSDDDELIAAELAFGLIDGEERRVAEQRLDSDGVFRAAYDRWTAYGAAMFTDVGEAPRPSVWTAIEKRLPANDMVVSRTTLRWWQGGTAAASAAALVLAVVALQPPPRPKPVGTAPVVETRPVMPLVAVLTGNKGVVTVSYDRISGRIISATSGIKIGDHSPELWVIPADGKPRSLGLIAAGASLWKQVPKGAAESLTPGVTLAISVEPLGGSPTGQPTGPVILTGKVTTA
jgi:anti-sigma-K factor RskA